MRKETLYIITVILLATIIYSGSTSQREFTTGNEVQNFSFIGDQNQTFYVDIPKGGYVTNASISIYGFNRSCTQEWANETDECGQSTIGNYSWLGSWASVSTVNNTFDGDYGTYGTIDGVGPYATLLVNYTIPPGYEYASAYLWTGGAPTHIAIDIPESCFNISIGVVSMNYTILLGAGDIDMHCHNGTEYTFIGEIVNAGQQLKEEHMRWNLSSSPLNNTWLEVGPENQKYEFEYSGSYTYIYTYQNLNISLFNDLLIAQCVCDNCTSVDNDCRIPFKFHSDTPGIIELNLSNSINYSIYLDNCSTNFNITSNSTSLNISFFNENSIPNAVNYKTTIEYWTDPTNTFNFSMENDKVTFTQICVYPSWANLTGDQQIEYTDADGNIFNYFTQDFKFDNTTDILNLFTQNGTTQVLFTVLDLDTNPVEDAYIHVLKYDVGTGTYTTTEVLKTDTQGQAIGNIILTTTFYNFLIYYNGALVYTEQAVKLVSTTRTFSISIGEVDWYTNFETTLGVNTNLYYNNATNNFVYTWSDPTATMHYGCMRVDKSNDTHRETLMDNCTLSTSGTMIYNIFPENGSTFTAQGYLKFDDIVMTDLVTETFAAVRTFFYEDKLGSLFIGFLFCLTMVMLGIPNPTIALAFLVGGIIFSATFGLVQITWMAVTTIAILALIQFYIAGRQNQ